MPVTPKQCIDNFTQKDTQEYERLVKTIDNHLLNHYTGQPYVSINTQGYINERVKDRLRKVYREAGWHYLTFKEVPDQRDGSYTEIKIGETNSTSSNELRKV